MPLEGLELPEDSSAREAEETLRELIAKLPLKDQRLLRLYLDGWKQGEIAQMLGISESNVQTRMMRAKEKLRKMNEREAKKNE